MSTCEYPPEGARTSAASGPASGCSAAVCDRRRRAAANIADGAAVSGAACSFVGGETCAQTWAALEAHAITHVVNCTAATCPDAFADRPSPRALGRLGLACSTHAVSSPPQCSGPLGYPAAFRLKRASCSGRRQPLRRRKADGWLRLADHVGARSVQRVAPTQCLCAL